MSAMADTDYDVRTVAGIDSVPLILDVVCRITGMGFAAVARVTDDKWIACATRDEIGFGLGPGGELPLKTTICDEIRDSHTPVVFDDADADPVFRNHHTPQMYGLKSYISFPIIQKNGQMFGTLCAIDPKPHVVNTPEITGMFKLFAELIATHLDQQDRFAAQAVKLAESEAAVQLRDQFAAVLGHDLRNPLGAITNAAAILERSETGRTRDIARMVTRSAFRMSELIDNLLDFARGQLGSGLSLHRIRHETLEPTLSDVVGELSAAWPERAVEMTFDFIHPVEVDAARIGQMVSNLVGNAFTHGDKDAPVRLRAVSRPDMFVVTVSNAGTKIPDATLARLFKPFQRGKGGHENGLGLGLYIASEIARAHGGDLTVSSSDTETVFRFRLKA